MEQFETLTQLAHLDKKLNDSNEILLFVGYIIIASLLAAFGLGSNNETALIGAMLISPIGGFIISSSISIAIRGISRDWYKLAKLAILLFVPPLIGLCIGLFYINVNVTINDETKPLAQHENWPTNEMKGRTRIINAIIMVPIAFACALVLPSAMINQDYVQLAAIGIATALLPPLVNVGISLSILIYKDDDKIKTIFENVSETEEFVNNSLITCAAIFAINFALIGIVSFFIFYITHRKDISNTGSENPTNLWRKFFNAKQNDIGDFDIEIIAKNYNPVFNAEMIRNTTNSSGT